MRGERPTVICAIAALGFIACGDDGADRGPEQRRQPDAAQALDAAGSPDTGSDLDAEATRSRNDAGTASGAAGAWIPPEVTPPAPGSSEPFWLSQTGLYLDIANKTLAPDLIAFDPKYELWSDGASKHRWLRLPPGAQVDTSDADHWVFPVGTMLFKQFASPDGLRLETRLVMRTGSGPEDYFMGAFVWDDAESDARFVPDGEENVRGTEHDVPRTKQCGVCHRGETGRVLGFSAVQGELLPEQRLSAPARESWVVPGDASTAAVLGYLHANCGHCHNLHGTAWSDTNLELRLKLSDTTPESTAIYKSAIDVMMNDPELRKLRIVRGDPEQSGVYYRMSIRGPDKQMPPFATEHVDDRALALVGAWIRSLKAP